MLSTNSKPLLIEIAVLKIDGNCRRTNSRIKRKRKIRRLCLCILQSTYSGEEWSVVTSCQKVELVVGSGASNIKSLTDISIVTNILQRCSQFLSTHDQASSSDNLYVIIGLWRCHTTRVAYVDGRTGGAGTGGRRRAQTGCGPE